MSTAHAAMTPHALPHALDVHEASRSVLGLAIVLALLVAAAFSFAAHGTGQATPDDVAQLGD